MSVCGGRPPGVSGHVRAGLEWRCPAIIRIAGGWMSARRPKNPGAFAAAAFSASKESRLSRMEDDYAVIHGNDVALDRAGAEGDRATVDPD